MKAVQTRRRRPRPFDARSIAAWLGAVVAPLAGRVPTPVLAKVDLELAVFLPVAHSLDRLDGVGDVGEVDEGAALLA